MKIVFSYLRARLKWILLSLVFLITFGYAAWHRIPPVVDARAYDVVAQNILAGRGFVEDTTKPLAYDVALLRAGPGYEYFLAGVYGAAGHNLWVVWFLQAFLHTASAWLIYKIARQIFAAKENNSGSARPEKIALLALALYGFSPDLIEISAMLMTETLYLFLSILGIYLFVRALAEKKYGWAAGAAGVLTLATLVRPVSAVLVVAVVGVYFWRKEFWRVAVCVVVAAAVLAPWTVRNFNLYHKFIPTTLIGDYNLWLGNTLQSNGGQFFDAINPVSKFVAENGIVAFAGQGNRQALTFVREHPGAFLQLTAVRTIRLFSLVRPMGFWFYQTGVPKIIFVALSFGWGLIVFIAGTLGAVRTWREKNFTLRILIGMTFLVVAPLVITVVQSRYRFQAYPFLALFAGYFLVEFFTDKKISVLARLKNYFIPLGGLLVISLIDIFISAKIILERLLSF